MSARDPYLFARLAAENDRTILETSLVGARTRLDAATRLLREQEREIDDLRSALDSARAEIRRLRGSTRA